MATKLYVGNLSYSTTDDSLQQAFAQAGNVVSAQVVIDKMTGRSRGFGFVEMDTQEAAQAAIELWNDKELDGRSVKVNEARPKEDRPAGGRGGFGGGRGGFGGNRGGGRRDFGGDRGGHGGDDNGGNRTWQF
jgi:RNA recognition motif-containing protein